jgi:hypothetical protein
MLRAKVLMILHLSWSRDVEGAGEGLVGDVPEAGGDTGVAVVAEGADCQVAQVAMFSGPCSVRIREAPSPKAVPRTKWSLF